MRTFTRTARACALTLLLCPAALQATQTQETDLNNASLEQLTQMRISVSSFSRKDEDLWKVPAAVYVISNEQIRRSAATSIPELLRSVPGIQVAQIDASTWAITARGFNNQFANKLLVLVDGRTVYSEIFSGVQWDEVDLPLQDVDHIEVIRGPGAAVWGTNAVNGVINILTKRTRSTLGYRVSGQVARSEDVLDGRYGATLSRDAQYRIDASALSRRPLETSTGTQEFDGENVVRGGGRLDWQKDFADLFTFDGSIYDGHQNQRVSTLLLLPIGPQGNDRATLSGGDLLGRWEHKTSEDSSSAIQAYYSDQTRHELGSLARTRTFDVDYQNHAKLNSRNDLVWGAETRLTFNHLAGEVLPTLKPDYNNYLLDGFVQDEISLQPEKWKLVLGSKIQQGTLAGFQVQPTARLLWTPGEKTTLWAAVSRAAVAPAIQEKGLNLPLSFGYQAIAPGLELPVIARLTGNPKFRPEIVEAYEAGFRQRLNKTLSVDFATFYNNNRRIQGLLPQTPTISFTPPAITVPTLYVNAFAAETAGTEATLDWKKGEKVQLLLSYDWIQEHAHSTLPPAEAAAASNVDTWSTPRNSASLTGWWNFAPNWSLNSFAAYVGSLPPAVGITPGLVSQVPAYTRFDLHVAREIGRNLELDAGGTNLLTPRHLEFEDGSDFALASYVPRSLFLKVRVSF